MFKDWRLIHWLITAGILILFILGVVIIYALLRPTAFVPVAPPVVVVPPVVTLPPEIPGPPEFPPVEVIPPEGILGTGIEPGVDTIARGAITRVSDIAAFPVEHFSIGPTGQDMNYYDPDTSRFYRIDADGVITKISDEVFAEVEKVTWAANAEDAILEFPDGSNIVYNFETGEQVTLPAHWQDFDFAPDSNSIAFKSIALDPDERWLAISDKQGSSARRIEHLGEHGDIVTVDWAPNNQVVGTYSRPDGLERSELFFLGFNRENYPLAKVQGLKPEGKWTPSGSQLLYSSIHNDTNFNPSLWLVDGIGDTMGGNRKQLGLETWTSKCSFHGTDTMYCGVPKSLPRGAGLIPSIADDIPDDLYKVDLITGSISRIAIPEENLNVQAMQVSADGTLLFIHDRLSGGIKKIRLE